MPSTNQGGLVRSLGLFSVFVLPLLVVFERRRVCKFTNTNFI